MDLQDDAKQKMFNMFDTFQDKPGNAAVYAGNNAYLVQKAKFKTALIPVNQLAAQLIIDVTGYSADKVKAKADMALQASNLSGYALVCFDELGKTIQASQLHISETDYTTATDTDAKDMAQATWQLLTDNFTDLNPDYLIQDDLDQLQADITTFSGTSGSSMAVQAATPAQRAAFKTGVKAVSAIVAKIRLLARKYKKSNATFYSQAIASSTLPPVASHHTILSVTAKNKIDNTAVATATGGSSNSKKTGIADATGLITIDRIRAGNTTLTVKAPGFKDNISQIQIISGQDNPFDILMEKL